MPLGLAILTLASLPHASSPRGRWGNPGGAERWIKYSLLSDRQPYRVEKHCRVGIQNWMRWHGLQSLQCHWGYSALLIIPKTKSIRCWGKSTHALHTLTTQYANRVTNYTTGPWSWQPAVRRVAVQLGHVPTYFPVVSDLSCSLCLSEYIQLGKYSP